MSTVVFENIREGLQECEARIFIEKAVLDKKLGAEMTDRWQKIDAERIKVMHMALVDHMLAGFYRERSSGWWQSPGKLSNQWYLTLDRKMLAEKLYSMAADVQMNVTPRGASASRRD